MKKVLNLELRTVTLYYPIKEQTEELNGSDEITYSKGNLQCSQTVKFEDTDKWITVKLYDGRVIEFRL